VQASEQNRKQILIVEDEGLIVADVQRRPEKLGYRVPAIAESGAEAIECARSTPFDLVLMDIRIKGDLDGIATAEVLRNEMKMPVVYMTAHSDQDTISRATLTEPFGFVVKPIADSNLRSAVQIAIYKSDMERRVRTSEAWLSTTLNSVGDAILATNSAGRIVFMNPVAEQLTGWTGSDARARLLMEVLGLLEERTATPAKNPITDLHPGEIRTYALVYKTGISIPVEIGCFQHKAQDEVLGAILVVRNISTRRELENRLIQSQRMEAVAAMAGGLAHDFNNQLTVILGYADELCTGLTGKEADHALQVKRAASIASSLTGRLLTSCRDAVRLETLNVNEVICEMQPMLSHSLGKTCAVVTDLGPRAGFVRIDRNQFKQALLNLALNARDAMPTGGELRIDTSTLEIEDATPEGRLYRPGTYVQLRVSDTGSGIDESTLPHIFEPFFTTKKAGVGTGFGLAMVHSIVTQNGGYISASSELGKGTRFEILLPCIGTFHRITDVAGDSADEAEPGATPTVLMVEEEDAVRLEMHGYLENEGFQLLEARNEEKAQLIAEVYQEPIHVLVTGLAMPGLSGPQLAKRLGRHRPNMKVLFVTRHGQDTSVPNESLDHGMSVLSKPFPPSELGLRIRALTNCQPDTSVNASDRTGFR